MQLGKLTIEKDGKVLFNGIETGTLTLLSLQQRGVVRRGNIGIMPCSTHTPFVDIASELASQGFAVTFDIYGKFWPNSFIKNGEWFAEIPQGEGTFVVPLKILATEPVEVFDDPVAESYSY